MTIVDIQLAAIKHCQDRPWDSSSPGTFGYDLANQVAFVLETKAPLPQTSLTGRLTRLLKNQVDGLDFSVETVFVHEEDPTFFVVEFSSARFEELPGSPFELCYFLKDELKLASVEPAIETDFVDWSMPTTDGPCARQSGEDRRDNVISETSDDVDWALRVLAINKARICHGVDGRGVKIAHIDTGIAEHVVTGNIDLLTGLNLFRDSPGATDPLTKSFGGNPGHGTATSSVIVGDGGFASGSGENFSESIGRIAGVSPGASLFPIRAIKSVVQTTQWRVARAIDEAKKNGVHVITMSLGGLWSSALKTAISRAVEANIIVLAAAGNSVGEVVYPARFRDCIGVAGIAQDKTPWQATCRGSEVDFSAPGQSIRCAMRISPSDSLVGVGTGQGTSFSVALSAGVAALWLERFGRTKLIEKLSPGETLQERFRNLVRSTAHKDSLPDGMGAGILRADALLDADTAMSSSMVTAIPARTDKGNVLFEDTLAMLMASDADDFGAAQASTDTNDIEALEPVSLEIMWRVFLDARRLSTASNSMKLPPLSEQLMAFKNISPKLAARIP